MLIIVGYTVLFEKALGNEFENVFFFISGPRVNLAKLAQSSNNPQRTNIHLEPIFTEDPDIRA